MAKKSIRSAKDNLMVSISGNKEKVVVDMDVIKRAQLTLRAILNPLRQKLLELIELKGEIGVSEIYRKFKIEQSVASSQLAILRRANVVTTKRDGQKIYYSINRKRISEIINLASGLAK
jgi:DNA-binding transcriptional ArsR family regulator